MRTPASFLRTGLDGRREREIRADVHSVTATEFATVLGDAAGPLVSTAEHVLAALRGLGVDNAMVEIDGPEVPIMDGSAAPFVEAIDQVGIATLDRAAPLYPGAQAGAGRERRRIRRAAALCARFPPGDRDRLSTIR